MDNRLTQNPHPVRRDNKGMKAAVLGKNIAGLTQKYQK